MTETTRNPARRALLKGAALAAAAAPLAVAASQDVEAAGGKIIGEEHWAQKGNVKLYLWRKRLNDGKKNKPVFFIVHGSSFSGRGGYDLQVPGKPNYSFMDEFARAGYDVWALAHETYGRSTRGTGVNSNIETGVADIEAAMPVVEKVTGQKSFLFMGQSSGAIPNAYSVLFLMLSPGRVKKRRKSCVDASKSRATRRTSIARWTSTHSWAFSAAMIHRLSKRKCRRRWQLMN